MSGRPVVNQEEMEKLLSEGVTQKAIASHFGVSKSAISIRLSRKVLRRNRARPSVLCACGCGLQVKARKYASRACYFQAVTRQPYVSWRQGQRIARSVVSQHFTLRRCHVVHHVDRDCRNNSISNLWVFATHADHMSHHRGGMAQPIWRGQA